MSNHIRYSYKFLVFILLPLTFITTVLGFDLDSQLHITNNFLSYPATPFFQWNIIIPKFGVPLSLHEGYLSIKISSLSSMEEFLWRLHPWGGNQLIHIAVIIFTHRALTLFSFHKSSWHPVHLLWMVGRKKPCNQYSQFWLLAYWPVAHTFKEVKKQVGRYSKKCLDVLPFLFPKEGDIK